MTVPGARGAAALERRRQGLADREDELAAREREILAQGQRLLDTAKILASMTEVCARLRQNPRAWPPQRYPVGSASQVLAGLATDPFFVDYLRYLRDETAYHHAAVDGPRPDTPVLIRGLVTAAAPAITDVWIVPVPDRGGFVVSIGHTNAPSSHARSPH